MAAEDQADAVPDMIPEAKPVALPLRDDAGGQLRAARERAGLSIEQVAQETRISRRYIEFMEAGDFAALPGRTYAIGFAKTYARLVGLDQAEMAERVGGELGVHQPAPSPRSQVFEPGDPARVPSMRLAMFAVAALVVLLIGVFFAARQMFAPAAELPSLVDEQAAAASTRAAGTAGTAAGQAGAGSAARPAPAPSGPVVFTALEEGIWVKFYTTGGVQLMQKLMAKGERFTVPEDGISAPLLWTGRPDALSISIGGRVVPRLAEDVRIMKDVPISAAALLTRSTPTPTPTPMPGMPTPGAAPSAAPAAPTTSATRPASAT